MNPPIFYGSMVKKKTPNRSLMNYIRSFMLWPFDGARVKRKSRDAKRASPFDGGSSKSSLDTKTSYVQSTFSNQVPSMLPKFHDHRLSNPKPKKGRDTS